MPNPQVVECEGLPDFFRMVLEAIRKKGWKVLEYKDQPTFYLLLGGVEGQEAYSVDRKAAKTCRTNFLFECQYTRRQLQEWLFARSGKKKLLDFLNGIPKDPDPNAPKRSPWKIL